MHLEKNPQKSEIPQSAAKGEGQAPAEGVSAGTIIDSRFEIESLVGAGSMSVVYKANDLQLNRQVALKILHKHLAYDTESIARFQRECVAASTLEHANIVRTFSSGVYQGQPYLSMEFIEGRNLAEILKAEQRLTQEAALPIFTAVADALEHAHQHGVIHRDLKPNNVMLSSVDNTVKLVDFGTAKILPESGKQMQALTATGQLLGTLSYMSPEQCMGFPLTARSDIYSMGCLMYEVLTGERAFKATTDYAIVARHMADAPKPNPYLDNELGSIVLWCLRKDAELRPESAAELKAGLLSPSNYKAQAKPKPKGRPTAAFAIATIAAMLGVAVLMFAIKPFANQSGPRDMIVQAESASNYGDDERAVILLDNAIRQAEENDDVISQQVAVKDIMRIYYQLRQVSRTEAEATTEEDKAEAKKREASASSAGDHAANTVARFLDQYHSPRESREVDIFRDAYSLVGEHAFDNKGFDYALACYKKATDLAGQSFDHHELVGCEIREAQAYLQLNQVDKADEIAQRNLKKNLRPDEKLSMAELCWALLKRENGEKVAFYRKTAMRLLSEVQEANYYFDSAKARAAELTAAYNKAMYGNK